jgi:signal transduction histidine kinase
VRRTHGDTTTAATPAGGPGADTGAVDAAAGAADEPADEPAEGHDVAEMTDLAHEVLAHDLRAPLTMTLLLARSLRGALEMVDEPIMTVQRGLEAIEQTLERADEVTSRILDYSTLGVHDEPAIPLDLAVLLAETDAARGDPRLRFDLEPVVVTAVPGLVHRAVDALLDNALRYSPSGRRVAVASRKRSGGAEITVADQGPGVPAALRHRVFDPFVRGTDERDGLGLGLAVVARVAELHGGRAWVHPARCGGSVFGLALPLAPTDQVA